MSTVQAGRRRAAPVRSQAVEQAADPEPIIEAPRRRRYTLEIPVDPELIPYLGLMLVALVLRTWDLGRMALHHDESLHAVYSYYLYVGKGYVHDPMMHGPLLFIGNALAYFLLGASDFTARIVPALLGVSLVGMMWFLRNELGKWGALAAAAFFVISPTFVYFSRFIRHDIYVDVFTLMMVIGIFRYLNTGNVKWFYALVTGTALLFATKEDFYISGFIPFVFLIGAWFLLKGERRQLYRARIRALGWRPWVFGIAAFLIINAVLYTTFFTNMKGLCTALWAPPVSACNGVKGALQYWLDQHDFARGGQPWFYYLMLLPLYELPPLVFGIAAAFLVRQRNLFFTYSLYWTIAAVGIYSWAGEKMPWMLPQMALPLILVAAKLLGEWAESGWIRPAFTGRGAAVIGLLLLAGLGFMSWLGLSVARTAVQIDQQTVVTQRLMLAVMIAAIAGGLVWLWGRWGAPVVRAGLVAGAIVILGGGYLRYSLLVNFDHPDTPDEPLIYVQSSPDVTYIAREIDRIASATGQGKDMPILMDVGWGDGQHEAVSWPFEWYLREYNRRTMFQRTIDNNLNMADYPVILGMTSNWDPIRDKLASFNVQKYKLNWWFPEDYKQFVADGPGFSLGPIKLGIPWLKFDALWNTLSDPNNRMKLMQFLIYREAPGDKGWREMYFGVNTRIPQYGGTGSTGIPAPSAPVVPRDAVAQPEADGSVVFGKNAQGQSTMLDPKQEAVGRDGKRYVIEAGGNRVTVFDGTGALVSSFGSAGTGDGQFREPWSLAIAPNGEIYVADTWNHRIQRFDANGKFLGKWGSLGELKSTSLNDQPSVFWGPRDIAISQNGEIFVTDTGNKRIQVFDLQGTFKRAFGGEGTEAGQLKEPVGLDIDSAGNVLVADTWNSRVQTLDPNGRPVRSFLVPTDCGWSSTAVTNKPYVAALPRDRVAVTCPDAGRVLLFEADGRPVFQFNVQNRGSAVGLAVSVDGRLDVVDAKNGIVASYPLP